MVAPTTDRAQVRDALENLQADGGTALGDAIMVSLQATADARTTSADTTPGASPSPSSDPSASASPDPAQPPLVATVLLSDGANSTGSTEPLDAASRGGQAARCRSTRSRSARRTARSTCRTPTPARRVTLDVPPDTQTLAAIAETTSGRFFEAPSSEDLAQIYQSLGSKVGYTQQEQEVTQWFAAAALLLVLSGAGLAALWFNRIP